MKIGTIKASVIAKSGRLDASFHLDPTEKIDAEIVHIRRRQGRDRNKLRELVQKRRKVLAHYRAVHFEEKTS